MGHFSESGFNCELRLIEIALGGCSDAVLKVYSKVSGHDIVLQLVRSVVEEALTDVSRERTCQLHRRVALEHEWTLIVVKLVEPGERDGLRA